MERTIKPLKEYVRAADFTNKSDMEIIAQYILDNELQNECIDLLNTILKAMIAERDAILNRSRAWIPNIVGNSIMNASSSRAKWRTTREEQSVLDQITCIYLLGMELNDDLQEKARMIFESRQRPFFAYTPMLEWLKEKYGIEFKEE